MFINTLVWGVENISPGGDQKGDQQKGNQQNFNLEKGDKKNVRALRAFTNLRL